MWVTSSSAAALTPTSVALGNFDGLHLGHRQVVQPILQPLVQGESWAISQRESDDRSSVSYEHSDSLPAILRNRDDRVISPIPEDRSNRLGTEVTERIYTTVVTFSPHPQEFFSGQPKKLLTPPPEKVKLLQAMGVEQLVLLPFDRELAALTPQEFVEEILVRQLRASQISVGLDFRFGRDRAGTATDLQAIAATYGIGVTLVPLYTNSQGERISSSAIRQALCEGELQRANQLLGRPYTLMGQVVKGQQLGRTLGFPTANLQLPPEKFLPRFGVYAVRVEIEDAQVSGLAIEGRSQTLILNGVMNLGCRPTVDGQLPTTEVHLLDWSGDLYGKTLTVSLESFLRSEQKFPSLDALKAQIQADCAVARGILVANG